MLAVSGSESLSFHVLVKEPLGSRKLRLKKEQDEGEEPDCKKVKIEKVDMVEVKFERHAQVHKVAMF